MSVCSGVRSGEIADRHGQRPRKSATSGFYPPPAELLIRLPLGISLFAARAGMPDELVRHASVVTALINHTAKVATQGGGTVATSGCTGPAWPTCEPAPTGPAPRPQSCPTEYSR